MSLAFDVKILESEGQQRAFMGKTKMEAPFVRNEDLLWTKSSDFVVNDAEILRLQVEISKNTEKSPLLHEVFAKLVGLWKDNVTFQKEISKLKGGIGVSPQRREVVVCKTCQEFKEEKVLYAWKYKVAEGQVEELAAKFAEREELFIALREEFLHLQTLFRTKKEDIKLMELGDVGTELPGLRKDELIEYSTSGLLDGNQESWREGLIALLEIPDVVAENCSSSDDEMLQNVLARYSRKTFKPESRQIMTPLPGPTRLARNTVTPLDAWSALVTPDILDIIVSNTNKMIDKAKRRVARDRSAKPTSRTEIQAMIGLLYLAGTYRSGNPSLEKMWAADGTAMPLARFRFLLRCLCFDDEETRVERLSRDNMAPIREVFTGFVGNFRNCYTIGEYATVDEKLEPYRGACEFRQYVPRKRMKCGIKVFALVDSRTFYTGNLEVYAGTQPEGPYKTSNRPEDVVERLCEHLSGSGRNVTMSERFTSYELARKLLNLHNLTIVGNVKKITTEMPVEFGSVKGRPVYSSLFDCKENCRVVSYIPKSGENVILLSTMNGGDNIGETTGNLQKPEMVSCYDSTKDSVDLVDKMCVYYSCARNTDRWPMVLFFGLLNVAAINAFVIFHHNTNTKKLRCDFLKELSLQLVKGHLSERAGASSLPREIRSTVARKRNRGRTDGASNA